VAGFAAASLNARERARRAGTRPRCDATIETHLSIIGDLACFLAAERAKTDWAAVDVHDVEAFLQIRPASRKRQLTALGQFFRWARSRRLLLIDPTRGITAPGPRGFRGHALTLADQRRLFRRWTSGPDVHPHEALTGLLALIHAATTQEIRHLTVEAIDPATHAVTLPGRPQPTPLDPWTWAALEACLAHRQALNSANPYLLITRQTKATRAPSSDGYVKNTLKAAGARPRILRSSRILALINATDPKLVATVCGMTYDAVTAYLADRVDRTRLPNP